MEEQTLWLSPAERTFLAYSLGPDDVWPPTEALGPLLRQVPGGDVAGGPRLRALMLALALSEREDDLAIQLTASELWLMDALLIRHDLRQEKLPDGKPLAELAVKVWRLILELYDEDLPDLRRETPHADFSTGEDTDQDTDAAIASAEAILRSGDRPRTGDDLPPATA